MKQITTTKATILVVDVPADAYDFHFYPCDDISEIAVIDWKEPVQKIGSFIKNSGHCFVDNDFDWKILGRANELTEEQWSEVVPDMGGKLFDYDPEHYYSFPDYLTIDHPFDSKHFDNATEAGLSLLKANGIILSNPLGEKPVNAEFYWGYLSDLSAWQEAQSKVTNPLILKLNQQ